MIIIRLTLADGCKFFVSGETTRMLSHINIHEDVDCAFKYSRLMEFKLTWHYVTSNKLLHSSAFKRDFVKLESDVVKFEYFDEHDLDVKEFDIEIKEDISSIPDEIYLSAEAFERLKHHPYPSDYSLKDANNASIVFPKEDDYKKVKAIVFYAHGLTHYIYSSWIGRHRDRNERILMTPIIQKLYLASLLDKKKWEVDRNKKFIVREKKI